jgi:hypothetical protein
MALVGESLEVVGRVYHTENGNVHLEGEQYAVTDRVLAETLVGIGFASPVGWSPDPPPPEGGALSRGAGRHDERGHDERGHDELR